MPKTLVERIHEKQLFFTYTLQFSHPKLSPWCGNEEGNPAYFLSSFHKVYLYRCNYSFAATSAALCLIISFTAALLLESDCCCNLLRCSLRSLCIVTSNQVLLQMVMLHALAQLGQGDGIQVEWINTPATRHIAFWIFASSGMELKHVPHFLAKDTASRSTCFALHPMTE